MKYISLNSLKKKKYFLSNIPKLKIIRFIIKTIQNLMIK
jgi:hypothetical protein